MRQAELPQNMAQTCHTPELEGTFTQFWGLLGAQKTRQAAGFSELLAADVAAVLLAAQARYATSCSGTLHGKGLVVRG